MEADVCVVFNRVGWGSCVAVGLCIVSWLALAVSVLWQRRAGVHVRFFIPPPPPVMLNRASLITWIFYCCGLLFQFTPVAILTRILPAHRAILAYDAYVFCWLAAATFALVFPATSPDIATLFLLWACEYFSLFAYNLIYITGLPLNLRRKIQFPVAYRMLIGEVLAYFTVVILAAAIYRSNAAFLVPSALPDSIRESLYISVVTITTIGFGDYVPRACLQWVMMGEALMGIFVLIVTIATVVGRIVGIIGVDELPEL